MEIKIRKATMKDLRTYPGLHGGSIGDHILKILFGLFEGYRTSTKKVSFKTFAKDYLKKMKWRNQEYLQNHIFDIAIRVNDMLSSKSTVTSA
jgi:hypothetical protein